MHFSGVGGDCGGGDGVSAGVGAGSGSGSGSGLVLKCAFQNRVINPPSIAIAR